MNLEKEIEEMLFMEKGYRYTIMYVTNTKEVIRDYPKAEVILLSEDEHGKMIAIKERRFD